MTIKTLKDIKNALKDVPDEILDTLYFGVGENCEDRIGLMCDDDDYEEKWEEIHEKYNGLVEFNKLIDNVITAQSMNDGDVSSEELTEALYEEIESDGITNRKFKCLKKKNKDKAPEPVIVQVNDAEAKVKRMLGKQ